MLTPKSQSIISFEMYDKRIMTPWLTYYLSLNMLLLAYQHSHNHLSKIIIIWMKSLLLSCSGQSFLKWHVLWKMKYLYFNLSNYLDLEFDQDSFPYWFPLLSLTPLDIFKSSPLSFTWKSLSFASFLVLIAHWTFDKVIIFSLP